jgi:thiol-disulfide isomerase/thioredoxin
LLVASGLAVVALAIATVVAFTSDDSRDVAEIDPNTPLPSLQGRDVTGQSAADIEFERFDDAVTTGATTTFGELAGQPLVVNFFGAWCAPCVVEMPEFERVHRRLGEDVRFVGISESESPENGRRIVEQTGVTYRLGRDPTGSVLEAFGGVNMPTTVFIDADGTIVKVSNGKLSEAELEQIIRDELLA